MNEIQKHSGGQIAAPSNFSEAMRISEVFAASGLFKDVRGAAQCAVKIMAGAELGLGAFQSMNAIHIIEGKPTLAAGTIATLVKRSGRYNYRVTRWDNAGCVLEFWENGDACGVCSFTEEDAKRAGLLGKANTWGKYPRAMYFARAMSMGARAFCADVFGGSIYTPEELGADVNEEGAPVGFIAPPEVPTVTESLPAPQPRQQRADGAELPPMTFEQKARIEELAPLLYADGLAAVVRGSQNVPLALWGQARAAAVLERLESQHAARQAIQVGPPDDYGQFEGELVEAEISA